MSDMIRIAKEQIRKAVANAANVAFQVADLPEFTVEIPADRSHGDFAANAAMLWARNLRKAPKMIADEIVANLSLDGTYFDRAEVAGPGFLNFFAGDDFYSDVLLTIEKEGEAYGRSEMGGGKKVMVEFVSANPTGPMHIGNARGGALGDGLAAVLDLAGYDVTREFYVNDAGNQIEKFGASLSARYMQIYRPDTEFPEDGYHGEDIKVRAAEFAAIHGDKFLDDPDALKKAITEYALPLNIEGLRTDLAKYRVNYDVWFKESSLYESGELNEVIEGMKAKGLTFEKDGALWYKATEYGGEKDEVLIRANGNPTYFAADIAYHRNKFRARGFDKVINIWGADHHGHVARLKGAMDAIGEDGNKLDVVLMQMVRLVRDGEVVKVSKRTGKSITLKTLLDEVPVDAARFYFNMREANSQFDFDLDLAVEQSSQNPVYYVQYAHARICSIIKNLAAEGVVCKGSNREELALLTAPEERELISHLASLTSEVELAAKNYDSSRITRYVMDLAALFHKFYNACRVRGVDEKLTNARLFLCAQTATVLKNMLAALKIDAPEVM
ncbi:MAG: arginine--tRNA ligase [Clostridia bacterium]|nr:arginine--tRNA ligase [Clostridia bacterium]